MLSLGVLFCFDITIVCLAVLSTATRNGGYYRLHCTYVIQPAQYFCTSRIVSSEYSDEFFQSLPCLDTPPELLVEIQNNFTELFLMMPSTKNAQMVLPR